MTLPKQILAKIQNTPFLLLACPDRIRRERMEEAILHEIENFSDQGSPEVTTLYASQVKSEQLTRYLDQQENFSLFAKRKVFLLREVDRLAASSVDQVLEWVADPPAGMFFLLVAEKPVKRSRLYKFFEKQNQLIALENLEGKKLEQWIVAEAKRVGFSEIEPGALSLLQKDSDQNADSISRVLHELYMASDSPVLKKKQVQFLPSIREQEDDFAIIQMLDKGEVQEAQNFARKLIANGKSEFSLLGLLFWYASSRYSVSAGAKKGYTPADIEKITGLRSFQVKKFLNLSRNSAAFPYEELFSAFVKADRKLKGKSLGSVYTIEELLSEFHP